MVLHYQNPTNLYSFQMYNSVSSKEHVISSTLQWICNSPGGLRKSGKKCKFKFSGRMSLTGSPGTRECEDGEEAFGKVSNRVSVILQLE
jgi:hypothetical protein